MLKFFFPTLPGENLIKPMPPNGHITLILKQIVCTAFISSTFVRHNFLINIPLSLLWNGSATVQERFTMHELPFMIPLNRVFDALKIRVDDEGE